MATNDITLMQKDAAGKWLRRTIAGAVNSILRYNDADLPELSKGPVLYRAFGLVTQTGTTEASILSTGAPAGSLSIATPASVLRAGSTLRFNLAGLMDCGAAQTLNLKPRLNGSIVGVDPITLTNAQTAQPFWITCDANLTAIAASTTVAFVTRFFFKNSTLAGWDGGGSQQAVILADTTVAMTLDFRTVFAAASTNVINSQQSTVELIY